MWSLPCDYDVEMSFLEDNINDERLNVSESLLEILL